jgi:cellulose synthase/poly-beta-1,6-N-acetylglucosamine synthase-like glycosyltransferase
MKKNSFIDYNVILDSPLAPSVSILVPAYNESKTIVDNIESIYSIHYNNFNVIIINDGSTDQTISKLIDEYDLVASRYPINTKIPTKQIKEIYKSRKSTYSNLIVVDKENGGKADALNVGLNVSRMDLFMAIDADSILEPDAILKLVKPFMERGDRKVIAAGGVIRIANSCVLENGRISEIRVPKNILARMQVLEYMRSFLMGRVAWAKLDGLIIISGAMGVFDKDIVIKSGGYAHTIGEDMELIVRVRKYMCENRENYKIEYVPDPLCWTQVPSTVSCFGRQRSRWTRGTMETLFLHSDIFFRKKYKAMGFLGYPYWFVVEWLAPIVECLGIVYAIFLFINNYLSIPFILLTFLLVYLFALFFTTCSILFEIHTYYKYSKKRDILKLWLTAFIEPFYLHPLNLFYSIKGNIEYLFGNRKWGKMSRDQFEHKNNMELGEKYN